ncbi:hypothetical protein BKA61DRAFT_596559 [Leptodontidium sp. MPI-SDFR-AT-0119]|nr:hypothetical protein BKA61DRAFT_596559 [Leptodontidium sp. MPI-SDFR-AT-0119]
MNDGWMPLSVGHLQLPKPSFLFSLFLFLTFSPSASAAILMHIWLDSPPPNSCGCYGWGIARHGIAWGVRRSDFSSAAPLRFAPQKDRLITTTKAKIIQGVGEVQSGGECVNE